MNENWISFFVSKKIARSARPILNQVVCLLANRLVFAVECRTGKEDGCPENVVERVRAALTKAGFQPAAQPLAPEMVTNTDQALAQAKEQGAAKLLLTKVRAEFLSSAGGEYYAQAGFEVQLLDAMAGRTLWSR